MAGLKRVSTGKNAHALVIRTVKLLTASSAEGEDTQDNRLKHPPDFFKPDLCSQSHVPNFRLKPTSES